MLKSNDCMCLYKKVYTIVYSSYFMRFTYQEIIYNF